MAKNQNTDSSNIDQNKRSKDEEARLEKEKQNQKNERELRQKRRKKKMLKLQKKEQKRIKWLVNLPFMTLFKVSILFTFLSFIFFHFWSGQDIFYSILNSFFIFTLLYLGMGVIMLGIFFLLSIDKEHELNEEIRLEQNRMKEEELKRQQEEMSELEALERELTEKKLKDKVPPAELPDNENYKAPEANMSVKEDEPQLPDFDDIKDKNEDEFRIEYPDSNKKTDNIAAKEKENDETQSPELPGHEETDSSYLKDIFGEEFENEKEQQN